MQSIRHVSAQRSIEDINNRVMKVLKAYDKINAQKVFRSMERMLQVKFANNSKICAPPPNFFLILHSCLHYEDENVQEQIFFLILDEMHQGVVSILHSQF